MLVAVGIFNMIMAIFLENATTSAARRKQRELGEKANTVEQARFASICKQSLHIFTCRRSLSL